MPSTVLHPTGLIGNPTDGADAWTVVGADANTAISDGTDSTYLSGTGNQIARFNLTDPTIPAGARIASVSIAARLRFDGGGNGQEAFRLELLDTSLPTAQLVTEDVFHLFYPSGTFFAFAGSARTQGEFAQTWTPAVLNAMVLRLVNYDNSSGSAGTAYVAEASVNVSYVNAPVATVTAPTGSQSTFYPTVAWTFAGDSQESFEVRIFTDADVGSPGFDPDLNVPTYDSGVVYSNATSFQVPVQLLSGQSYWAYVRVTTPWGGGEGPFYSAWAHPSSDFTISVAGPNAPSISRLVADPDQARVWIEATVGAGGITALYARFESSADGGTTWQVLRGSVPYSSGKASMYDYEVPAGTMRYRVASVGTSSGQYVTGAYSAQSRLSCFWQQSFLRDPISGSNVAVRVAPPFGFDLRDGQGVYETLGRRHAVVMTDGRKADKGKVKFWLVGEEAYDIFVAMVAALSKLRLDLPNGEFWYLRFGDIHFDKLATVAPFGSERPVGKFYSAEAPYIEVDRPTTNIGLLTIS